mmetsp:Transcript_100618/g.259824  ORF Transcript_100618/g.259824 Transcript_100618/m.259824 type:complete len:320 (+) Transcript_100618:278-1237(+)
MLRQEVRELHVVHDAGAVVVAEVEGVLHRVDPRRVHAVLLHELGEGRLGGRPGGAGLEVDPALLRDVPDHERVRVQLLRPGARLRGGLRRRLPGDEDALLIDVLVREDGAQRPAECVEADEAVLLRHRALELRGDRIHLLQAALVLLRQVAQHGEALVLWADDVAVVVGVLGGAQLRVCLRLAAAVLAQLRPDRRRAAPHRALAGGRCGAGGPGAGRGRLLLRRLAAAHPEQAGHRELVHRPIASGLLAIGTIPQPGVAPARGLLRIVPGQQRPQRPQRGDRGVVRDSAPQRRAALLRGGGAPDYLGRLRLRLHGCHGG